MYTLLGADRRPYSSETPGTLGGYRPKKIYGKLDCPSALQWIGDPYQQLLRANHRYLEVFNNHKGLWRCLIEGLHQSKAVEAMWLDLRRPFIEQLARHLARLSESGAIRRLDAVETAYALGSMVEWFAFTHLVLGEPPLTEDSIDKAAVTLTDLWFHAVYGRDREVAD